MKLKIENQKLQDKEVDDWWNDEKTKKWHHFTYDKSNFRSHHVIPRQKKVLQYLKSLNLPKGSKILELGFGGGQTANIILKNGYKYCGIDISKHLCEESEKKSIEYVKSGTAKFFQGSIEKKYPFEDGEFDACVVLGALQYVGDLDYCFNEIRRVLKKDGNFIVAQANMYGISELIYPRSLILRILYFVLQEEFLISPCFKSMLCNSKLKKIFGKYENSKFMNNKFMLKGFDLLKYKIRKRMYSKKRLKNILLHYNFDILKQTGTPFFYPKKNFFYFLNMSFDYFFQKLVDYKILPFLDNVADNVILLSKKK
tara:strand:+ start:657 stop:1592 length:936 start_codon:yes stop_codon:yes gene_type:complete